MSVVMPLENVAPGPHVRHVEGGVCAPRGFRAAGLHIGVKRQRRDLALILSDAPAAAAGTFTTNLVKAAPVLLTQERVRRGSLRAVVVNSGNANCGTGPRGMADARAMAEAAAAALGVEPEAVAVASTGVIGVPMPMDKILPGIARAARLLHRGGSPEAAEAIMTTDTHPKELAVEFDLLGRTARIGGIAKGSGMIHPDMATMLCFLTTDAAIDGATLQRALRRSVDRSFNMISVDGDTSTNDMVLCLANGMAGNPVLAGEGAGLEAFQAALDHVTTDLAKAVARDGEGATRLVEIHVINAPTGEDARRIGKAIANSNLVKTAIYGEDANWGRILCAAGYSGARFDPERVDIYIGDLRVAQDGAAVPFDEERASELLRDRDVWITVDLKQGTERATVWTCDLTYDYVKINASYRS